MTDHGRLIRANNNSNKVTHHCCPRNGTVHEGHPAACTDLDCLRWAQHLANNTLVKTDEARQMGLVAFVVLLTVAVVILLVGWFIFRR